jgi:hypothetical protein
LFGFLETLRKRKLGEPLVVVSGLPRSGTSMMMKMLDAGGLDVVTDAIRTADEDNPKGYFELEQVKDLDKGGDKSWVRDHRGKVVKIISFLLTDLPDDCAYKIIFMRRDLNEVIASQNKMLERRGETGGGTEDDRMIDLYTQHLRKMEIVLGNRKNFERLDVAYRDALEKPRQHAERIAEFLERPMDVDAMAAVVDKQLYRNRSQK